MRSVMGLASTLVVMLIAMFIYKSYFTSGQAGISASAPTQVVDVMGVKNDLVSIGQAERIYQAEHNSYGTIDDLVSSGAMAYKKTGREGYTYESEGSTDSFRIVARCTEPAMPGCVNFAIDQTMEVTSTQ
jgi:hypothetical protein